MFSFQLKPVWTSNIENVYSLNGNFITRIFNRLVTNIANVKSLIGNVIIQFKPELANNVDNCFTFSTLKANPGSKYNILEMIIC